MVAIFFTDSLYKNTVECLEQARQHWEREMTNICNVSGNLKLNLILIGVLDVIYRCGNQSFIAKSVKQTRRVLDCTVACSCLNSLVS